MNVVEIESEGLRIECALFGVYADELTNFLGGGDLNNPVVIVQFAKVKSFQGNNSIQNVHGATKILFDPPVPMADVLKRRFLEKNDSGSRSLSQLTDSKSVSGEDDFLVLTSSKTIAELKDLKKDVICVVYGRICPIEEGVEWWYTACRCNRKVYADEKMFFCESCNRHVLAVYPRYRLQLTVEDHTGIANLVLFDKEASSLVGRSCTEMVEVTEKDDGSNGIPEEIAKFIGTAALFKIEVKNFTSLRFDRSRFEASYRVKRVCTDEDIIQQFKKMQLEHNVRVHLPYFCYTYFPNDGSDINPYGIKVGASSSCVMVTPQSTLKHEGVAKDLMEDFGTVGDDKSPVTPFALESPTIDLNGDTQDIINSKRSLSTENEELVSGFGRKKKMSLKMKKDKM
ncbi:replication protein A 70 kDa DNA-binding subunit C-like [Lotus japonicus]|uniref:replication protein A 70 kDa DNA-binding subunit C-like n=1 Tax=Lotus japonicus TaxID=34305 RepID=UPI00258D62CD|nr:replication protein A 70 kDa DNA-binding subunit C-like [Lotus japonicus]